MELKKALLIVDVQNDFCPDGALSVPEGNEIVPILNEYIEYFLKEKSSIIFTRDWHPRKTKHFKEFGGLWPEHCIENTKGAEFYPDLKLPKEAIVISKGTDPTKDGYSAFEATDFEGNDLFSLLKGLKVQQIYIGGLATDYCVRQTTLAALKYGFNVKLLMDGIKGVDVTPGDSKAAIEEMLNAGAEKITLNEYNN